MKHKATIVAVQQEGDQLILTVDFKGADGTPIMLPPTRNAIADEVALALGNPLPPPILIPLTAHTVTVPVAAIWSRMELYGLTTKLQALEAIMREHVGRLADDLPTPKTRDELVAWIDNDAEALVTVQRDVPIDLIDSD